MGLRFHVIFIVLVMAPANTAVFVLAAWLGEELNETGLTI